ncbi:hypothetical protein [Paraflavitalea pollutisoli]|nr:hypothetical protein [Paraflavitalea sp. H1-2-19X]
MAIPADDQTLRTHSTWRYEVMHVQANKLPGIDHLAASYGL